VTKRREAEHGNIYGSINQFPSEPKDPVKACAAAAFKLTAEKSFSFVPLPSYAGKNELSTMAVEV